jgi:NitT/TauT family transport system ATP-binding protein
MAGMTEAVAQPPYSGRADLPDIARQLQLEIDELFPVGETLQMLRLAELEGGDIRLTEAGRRFAESEITGKKRIFAQHLIAYLPLAAHIRRVLDERPNRAAPKSRFSEELQDHMTPEAAEMTLRSVINWGRFAEIFAYDDDTQRFTLENPS